MTVFVQNQTFTEGQQRLEVQTSAPAVQGRLGVALLTAPWDGHLSTAPWAELPAALLPPLCPHACLFPRRSPALSFFLFCPPVCPFSPCASCSAQHCWGAPHGCRPRVRWGAQRRGGQTAECVRLPRHLLLLHLADQDGGRDRLWAHGAVRRCESSITWVLVSSRAWMCVLLLPATEQVLLLPIYLCIDAGDATESEE